MQAILALVVTFAILNIFAAIQLDTAADSVLSVPGMALIFLFGAFLPLPDTPTDEIEADAKRKITRRRARNAILRLILMLIGLVGLGAGLLTGLGDIKDTSALVLITLLYTVLIFFVQRAEKNRRIATLIFMAFCGFIIGRYVVFRGYIYEENWAVYWSLALNYIFWVLIGRHYPPPDSSQIEVWGMDGE